MIAFCTLSRGWLSGQFRSFEDLPEKDFRRMLPRFQPAVFGNNLKLVDAVETFAKRKGVTSAQVAMAWVRNQGAIPIPGSTNIERMKENCVNVPLSDEDLEEIQKILDTLPIRGERYGGKREILLNQ